MEIWSYMVDTENILSIAKGSYYEMEQSRVNNWMAYINGHYVRGVGRGGSKGSGKPPFKPGFLAI